MGLVAVGGEAGVRCIRHRQIYPCCQWREDAACSPSLPSAFANWDLPQPGGASRSTPRGRLLTVTSLWRLTEMTSWRREVRVLVGTAASGEGLLVEEAVDVSIDISWC